MNWNRRYAIRSYLLSTIWTAPVVALVLEQATFRLMSMENFDFGWVPGFALDREGAIAGADYIIASTIAFLVFTFSSLLVAIQVASGQLTPRIIATTLLRDSGIRWSVAVFVYALASAVAVKSRAETIPHSFVSLGDRWTKQRGRVPVFNRPCCTAAASGQHRGANSSAGTQSLRRRLSQPHTRVICTYASSRKPWPTGPDGLASRQFCNRHCGKSPGVGSGGEKGGRHHRGSTADGGFRCKRRPLVSAAWPRRERNRRRQTTWANCVRTRAHHRAGLDLCTSRHCRYRDQGAVAGDQRPNHRCASHRSTSAIAAYGRGSELTQREVIRQRWATQGDLSDTELGRLRASRLQRDQTIRRGKHPGRAAPTRDDPEPTAKPTGEPPPGAATATGFTRCTLQKLYAFPEDLARARIADSQGLGGSSGSQVTDE